MSFNATITLTHTNNEDEVFTLNPQLSWETYEQLNLYVNKLIEEFKYTNWIVGVKFNK